jgi:UDP-glucose 4-epimerase
MKTILITGGAGYIGSHTVVELLKNPEYDVIIIDNFSNSNPEIINRLYDLVKRPIKIYHRDCRDQMDDILSEHKVDSIIHFAAYKAVGESVESPIQYYDNNINSLLNMLDTAKHFGIKNFVFSSSCSLYGNLKELPATEESSLSEPESPYAYTKLIGEQILKDFSKVNPDFKIVSLRYFNPVGAHESGLIGESPINKPNNILPVICNSAETGEEMMVFGSDYETRDGSCIRDYVHVSDIAEAHVKAFEYLISDNSLSYDVYNLGLGIGNRFESNGLSVLEVINAFERVNNVKVNYKIGDRRSGDVVEIYSNSTKARKIGWKPVRTVDDMVSSAWKWHKNKI